MMTLRAAVFGDIIATEGDCAAGTTAVRQLESIWKTAGRPPEFAAAVTAIVERHKELDGSWMRQLPFSPVCGTIKDVGNQAAALAKTILAKKGQQPIPGAPGLAPGPSQQLTEAAGTMIKVVGGLAAVAAVAVVAQQLQARRGRR